MGAQESHLAGSPGAAYHVLRVAHASPAAEAGFEPFFDYIVGLAGRPISDDPDALVRWLDLSEDKPVTLQVYSSRRQAVRNVRALPHRNWSSQLPSTDDAPQNSLLQPSLLGLSLRLCNPQNALSNVWHVLDIVQGSPAQDAGLVPFGDWIIGYAGGILKSENDFYEVVAEHEDRPLRLFVYSADYEVTREVVIVPNRSWGSGEGLLGCSIGFGLLHRIPKTTTKTTAPSYLVPSETRGSSESPSGEDAQQSLTDVSGSSLTVQPEVSRRSGYQQQLRDRSTSPSPSRVTTFSSPLKKSSIPPPGGTSPFTGHRSHPVNSTVIMEEDEGEA